MNLKLSIFILFNLICQVVVAQVYVKGTVINLQINKAVPFATLGIKGKNIGTVADENGQFDFTVDNMFANEQLIVSSVGYNSLSVQIEKFKQGKQQLMLSPSAVTLNAVTIKPQKFKTKVFGRTGNSSIMTANMFLERELINDNLGKEQASIISINKNCYLRDFNLFVQFNNLQSIKFRLNFYNVKGGLPGDLIVHKDIVFDIVKRNGWLKVDLTPYNIHLSGYKEIAVAIQWVQSVKNDTVKRSSFGVSAVPAPFHAMYFRNKSQADWKKFSNTNLAFNITADSYKPDKEANNESEENITVTDSVANYLAYTRFAEEARQSGYGNNTPVGKYVNLPDADIYYETYGTGRPLVLLHGNISSISSFYKQIRELSKGYKVIAIDSRGQGKSTDRSTAPLTYGQFALDVKLVLDALDIKKADIVGWSDGGNTGLILAFQYPQLVNKLVTVGAVLSPDGVEEALLVKFKSKLDGNLFASNNKRLLALMVNQPHITTDELKKITAPVLVIAGQNDVVKPAHTQTIADSISGAKLLIVKDATHYVPQEKAEEFNAAVLSFLK